MKRVLQVYLAYYIKKLKSVKAADIQSEKGFTLLELLITVVIIGILASIAIPAYVATVDKFHYGKAKIQMGCMKRELEGFRMEKGYFPTDTNRNVTPAGIECFYTQSSKQVPFDSMYDYENWTASGGCLIQITFFGKNKDKNTASSVVKFANPGFYQEDGDDLVLSLGIQPQGTCVP